MCLLRDMQMICRLAQKPNKCDWGVGVVVVGRQQGAERRGRDVRWGNETETTGCVEGRF